LYPGGYNLGLFKMTKTELQVMSQGEAAYHRLYEAIRSGDFRPGDRLREIEVAKRLDLSRTPVREALRKLESDGIVEHRPRLGAVIRTLTPSEVVELYEMRLVLERTAAQMAAKHANDAEIDLLNDLNDQIAALGDDTQQAAALNQDFHHRIYLAERATCSDHRGDPSGRSNSSWRCGRGPFANLFAPQAQGSGPMSAHLYAYTVAGLGVLAFKFLHLPLPWLLGPIFSCLIAALLGVPMRGFKVINEAMRSILGVAVGATFSLSLLVSMGGMWPTLLLIPVMTTCIGLVGVFYFQRLWGFDFATSYYSAMPGGLQDMLVFGEEAGGNLRTI